MNISYVFQGAILLNKKKIVNIRNIVFCCLLCLVFTLSHFCYANISREYQIKAVFLYNYSKFITWPEHAFSSAGSPFTLCLLGKDPFGQILDITVEKENMRGRKVEIKRIQQIDDITGCQILYISKSVEFQLRKIYRHVRQYPILTVSDISDFVGRGGMIEFINENNKVRFTIDSEQLRSVGLQADANLLKIAVPR